MNTEDRPSTQFHTKLSMPVARAPTERVMLVQQRLYPLSISAPQTEEQNNLTCELVGRQRREKLKEIRAF